VLVVVAFATVVATGTSNIYVATAYCHSNMLLYCQSGVFAIAGNRKTNNGYLPKYRQSG